MGSPFYVAAGRAACYTKGKRSVLGKKGAEMKGHRRGQQGAILVLTAFLLPFIIAFTGMAVDFGNLYVQHQRLQNAADAAVLAGAKAYAENNEKPDDHPKADARAKEYIVGQYHNLAADEDIKTLKYKAQNFQEKTYYHVELSKDEPLYFLSFIKKTQVVSVSSTASIEKKEEEQQSGFFDNLFIYQYRFFCQDPVEHAGMLRDYKNNLEHPSADVIRDTFDGKISYTDGTGNPSSTYLPGETIYISDAKNVHRYFTSEAKNPDKKIKDLFDDNQKASFGADGTYKNGIWSTASFVAYDYDKFYNYMEEIMNGEKKQHINNNLVLSSESMFHNNKLYLHASGSFDININSGFSESDIPLYVYIVTNPFVDIMIHINVNSDMKAPLILCFSAKQFKGPKIELYLNGHTFKGVIYNPHMAYAPGGCGIHCDGGKFIGTYVAPTIDIWGKNASFIYKDFIGNNNSNTPGSGSSGGDIGKDSPVRLVSTPDGLSWN